MTHMHAMLQRLPQDVLDTKRISGRSLLPEKWQHLYRHSKGSADRGTRDVDKSPDPIQTPELEWVTPAPMSTPRPPSGWMFSGQ